MRVFEYLIKVHDDQVIDQILKYSNTQISKYSNNLVYKIKPPYITIGQPDARHFRQ